MNLNKIPKLADIAQMKTLAQLTKLLDEQAVAFKSNFIPPAFTKNRRELTNKRILANLKKLGVATQAEVRLLQSRVEKLENELKALKSSR